jgi:hypothetical protein
LYGAFPVKWFEIGAVRPLGIDVGVVRAEAGVGTLRVALGRRLAVALAGPGQPPAADLDRLEGFLTSMIR